VTGLCLLPLASAQGGDGARDDDGGDDTFRVSIREIDFAELDLGDPGPSLGDRFVFTDDLYRRDKRVGSDYGECVLARLNEDQSSVIQCVVTANFPGKGQITAQGIVQFTEEEPDRPFRVAITGGTGKYRDAGGVVIVNETVEPGTLTFRLTD